MFDVHCNHLLAKAQYLRELQQNCKMLESNYFQKVIFKNPMFLQPEGVNLWQFKIRLFDLEISEVYGIGL